jgi:diguanylate cyclase (GGDEF)-like protein
MSYRQLRFFALAGAVALAALFAALAAHAWRLQAEHGWAMHLIGRQRVLVAQMRLEAQAGAGGDGHGQRVALDAHHEFEDLLEVLRAGGPAPGGAPFSLPGPRSTALAAQLDAVQSAWSAFHPLVHTALEAGAQTPPPVERLEAVAAAGDALLAELDAAAALAQAEAQWRGLWLQAAAAAALLGALPLLVVALPGGERRLARWRPGRARPAGPVETEAAVALLPSAQPAAEDLEAVRLRLGAAVQAQQTLLAFSQTLMAADDERVIGEAAVGVAGELLRAEYCALVLPDERGEWVMQAVRGWPADYAGRERLDLQDTQSRQTLLRRQPAAVADFAAEVGFSVPPIVRQHGLAAGLSVPVPLDGAAVGALWVNARARRQFGEASVQLLSLIANQTGAALTNVRLLAAERRRADQLEGLRATTADILRVAEYDLAELLRVILRRAVALAGATGGDLAIADEAGLVVVGSHNLDTDHAGRRLPLGQGLLGRAAQTRAALVVEDYAAWDGHLPEYAGGPWHAAMGAPLLAGDRLVGAIDVLDERPERRFTPADLRLLTLFAQQAALAIVQARLFAAERQRVKEAETLQRAGAIVASTLKQKEAIELILQQLELVIPYDSASVQLLCAGGLEVVGGRGWATLEKVIGVRFPIPGDNPNTLVLQEQRPHILADAPAAYPIFGVGAQSHIRSWLGVPLVVGARVIGMLAVDSRDPGHFTAEHARLASAFADQVAIVFENARLYQAAVRAADNQAILYAVGREISASLEPEQVYAAIHRAAAQLMPAEAFVIALLSEARQSVEIVYLVDHGRREWPAPMPPEAGLSGRILATGQPVLLADSAASPALVGLDGTVRPGALLAVPLRVGDRVLGMLAAHNSRPGVYTEDDLHLLELLAVNAGIALSNARLFAQVQQLAITDPLTGLHNRRHFFELAALELERMRRYERGLAALMLDIDHFKRVNDAYGHTIGDEVLREVAARCRLALRGMDLLARYGGEEFVALLPETDAPGTRAVAERLRRLVSDLPIETRRGPLRVTVSVGYALTRPGETDLPALLQRADHALYAAKAAGRDCVQGA